MLSISLRCYCLFKLSARASWSRCRNSAYFGKCSCVIKTTKMWVFCSKITYLEHVLRPKKLEIEDRVIKSLKKTLPPPNKRELRSFIGLCSAYRRFVLNFAHIAGPLKDMLRKLSPETFDNFPAEQLGTFEKQIKTLTSASILHLPQPHQLYLIDTDVSDHQIGCVLFQTNAETNSLSNWIF